MAAWSGTNIFSSHIFSFQNLLSVICCNFIYFPLILISQNVYFLQKASSGLFYACYGYSNKATVPPFNSVKSCCMLCLPFAFNQESRELLTMEKDSQSNERGPSSDFIQ
ncbi:hypothetical protein RDI58_019012 [Solanum bulbocastanum]|uniref:Uncharacterized protein n=1 Tax=Solanum bulbocastanum TaxID=147425 RepID=A0AAN8TIE1_SOLBU